MRILLAPDAYRGMLPAQDVAAAMVLGWARGAAHDRITALPLNDGGPGLTAAVRASLGGDLVPATVTGPAGDRAPAAVLALAEPDGLTVVVEAASALGAHLAPAGGLDPAATTSTGLGELLVLAAELGAARVVVGLGGCLAHDAGAGLLAALGVGTPALRAGGSGLAEVTARDLVGLEAARERLAGVRLEVACDVDVPLLGLHGSSAVLAPSLGATLDQAQGLERAFASFVHEAGHVVGPGAARSAALLPGAGAGGGAAFALALLGATLTPGPALVGGLVGLAAAVARADLVVTGSERLDGHTLHGSVTAQVAAAGLERGVPVVVVAGEVLVGRREWSASGIAGAYAVAERFGAIERIRADATPALVDRAARVAATWSR